MQGSLALRQPATLQYVSAALVQLVKGQRQTLMITFFPVVRFQQARGVLAVIFQIVNWSDEGAVVITVAAIKANIYGTQTAFHPAHFFDIDTKIAGNCMRFIVTQPRQLLFGAAQIEKQLALRLGGRHFDNPPVAQYIFVNFRFNPMHSKRHQTHPFAGIKALYRLH